MNFGQKFGHFRTVCHREPAVLRQAKRSHQFSVRWLAGKVRLAQNAPKKLSLRAVLRRSSPIFYGDSKEEIASTSKVHWFRNDGFLQKEMRLGAVVLLAMTNY